MQTATPAGIGVDISLTSVLGNRILDDFDALREHDPVHWSEASQGWMITRHADIDDALQGRFPLSLKRVENMVFAALSPEEALQLPLLRRYLRHWPVEMDAPEHTRLRKLLVKALNKKVVDATRPFIAERVRTLMDKLEAQPEIEFNEGIARLLPGSVILKLLGLSQDLLPRLKEWADAFQEGISVPYATMAAKLRAERAMAEMTALFADEIALRRRSRSGEIDLIRTMVDAEDDGEAMSDDEIIGALQLTIVAGHDTTGSTLTLGLAALAGQPALWEHMHGHPQGNVGSCLELMRYIAMSAAQPRRVIEDFEWHGRQIRKDQFVWLVFAAGNRDPRVFENPQQIDPERTNMDRSLVFAPGMHHCIGHLLAKAQVTEFFGALVQRFEGAELLDPGLSFMPQIVFRGLNHLNVRMLPRTSNRSA